MNEVKSDAGTPLCSTVNLSMTRGDIVMPLTATTAVVTRSRGGPGHGTLRWTRASEQAGKALRSQGHHCAHVL